MTIIIPAKGSATSSMLDIWQAHIAQQQADKAQAAQAAQSTQPAQAAQAAQTAKSADTGGAANATRAAQVENGRAEAAGASDDAAPQSDGEKVTLSLRSASEAARQAGKAMTSQAAGGGGAGDSIVEQTIRKLKDMLAKVMAQLEAVRNNDRLPPDEKMQQVSTLSSEAMAIQAQITALMDPTKTTGTRVNTTA
ncbi:hypothetical protein PCA31118_04719 [Pandoraea captiosa]|uniref:Uncharacterized protein n=1 Tax=Pandoraea captiosa TaxID=2508302 RepID=A0A5E5AML9_9BURK|nr:hypothetical protein [Pandoraea captiosa]VVE74316.1 hypothetical protein PCA31118_04719 [Pandoraea captiosa]